MRPEEFPAGSIPGHGMTNREPQAEEKFDKEHIKDPSKRAARENLR